MDFLHKEKERMRHHRQLRLLNKVIEHVPKLPNESQTKVRKLRRLVVYAEYLRLIHSQLGKGPCNTKNNNIKKQKTPVPVMKALKVSNTIEHYRRGRRAHIVFLQSANCNKGSSFSRPVLCDIAPASQCNSQNSISTSSEYEYQVPEVCQIEMNNLCYNPESSLLLGDSRMALSNHVSLDQYGLSPRPVMSHYDDKYNESEPNLTSENLIYNDKGNYDLIEISGSMIEPSIVDLSTYNTKPFMQNAIFSFNEQNVAEVYSSKENTPDYILKDITFSNVGNENFKIPNIGALNGNEHFSSQLETFPMQYTSGIPCGSFHDSRGICNYESSCFYHSIYGNNCPTNFVPVEPVFLNCTSLPENESNSGSSNSTEKAVDAASLSDSSPSYNADMENSISFNLHSNICDHPIDSSGDSTELTIDISPNNNSVKSEPMENKSDSIPMYANYNDYEGDDVVNEISYTQTNDMAYQPYVNSFYPTNLNWNQNSVCSTFIPTVHSVPSGMIYAKNAADAGLFFSSVDGGFQSEEFYSQPKSEIVNCDDSSFSGDNTESPLLEDEISYPLAQYFSTC